METTGYINASLLGQANMDITRQFDIVRRKPDPLDLTRAATVRETIEAFDFQVGYDGTILFFDEGGLGIASFVAGSWLEVKEVR